jgi:2-polyprenyl-3-methyl-5-hydroxy-6-metoxy-1,4-benzoquinol methylase
MPSNTRELSEQVKRQMNAPPIHEAWEKNYRTEGNERTFEQGFDYIVKVVNQPEGARALDIGCGIGANSVRLARRGYLVSAADYSEPILERARTNVRQKGLDDRIMLGREDILALSYPDDYFDLVLCFGVLMHIPDIERAVSELIRVARPGGFVVLEEINMRSPEARLMHAYWRLFKGKKIRVERVPSGFEQTCRFADEVLFWRHSDPRWLVERFARQSCTLYGRGSSTFSELHGFIPVRPLKACVDAWNRTWIRGVNLSQAAYHNIFIFKKA